MKRLFLRVLFLQVIRNNHLWKSSLYTYHHSTMTKNLSVSSLTHFKNRKHPTNETLQQCFRQKHIPRSKNHTPGFPVQLLKAIETNAKTDYYFSPRHNKKLPNNEHPITIARLPSLTQVGYSTDP